MEFPSAALVKWRIKSGVITKVQHEDELRASELWGLFLWRCYRRAEQQTHVAWFGIKESCHRLFPDQINKQQRILFEHLPNRLVELGKREPGLSFNQRLSALVGLTMSFPLEDEDRTKLEVSLVKKLI